MYIQWITAWYMVKKRKFQCLLLGIIFILLTTLLTIGTSMLDSNDATDIMLDRSRAADSLVLHDRLSLEEKRDSMAWWAGQEGVETVIIYNIHMANLSYTLAGDLATESAFLSPYTDSEDYDIFYKTDSQKSSQPKGNEIIVNYNFAKSRGISIGDQLTYSNGSKSFNFIVKEFFVDPQFSNPFMAPNRFIVRADFFEEMAIDYSNHLLAIKHNQSLNDISLFEDYKKDLGLQGMLVDQKTIRTSYSIVTKLIASLLITVSILIFLIVIFVIRTLIRNIIQEQYKQIGVKKVMGYSNRQIRGSFVYLYTSLSFLSAFIGRLIAVPIIYKIHETLNYDLQVTLESKVNFMTFLPMLIVILSTMFFTILATRASVKIKAVQAIKYGMSEEKNSQDTFKISNKFLLPLNLLIGLKQLASHKRKTLTSFILITLIIFAAFTINNAGATLENNDQLLINLFSLDFGDAVVSHPSEENINGFMEILKAQESVDQVAFYQYKIGQSTQALNGSDDLAIGAILVYGDFPDHGLKTVKGRQPVNEKEIALSSLASSLTGKGVGDYISLDQEDPYMITGLFNTVNFAGIAYFRSFSSVSEEVSSSDGMYWLYGDYDQVIRSTSSLIDDLEDESISLSQYDTLTKDVLMTVAPFPIVVNSILLVFLIITSVIILNTTMIDINQSRRTYGILKVVGYSNQSISLVMLIKSLLITGMASLCGFVMMLLTKNGLMSILLSFTPFPRLDFNILIDYKGSIILVSLFILLSIVATLLPSRKIRLISPKILMSE